MSTLKERKANELEREEKILGVLCSTKKALEEEKRSKKQKKKTINELLNMLEVDDIMSSTIRHISVYQSRSCNLDKQLIGLLQHLFVRYPVPYFLYDVCIAEPVPVVRRGFSQCPTPPKPKKFVFMRNIYRSWFVTLAQGGSFKKAVKGFMTSTEAAMFLKAPVDSEIHENVWWAKLHVAGIPRHYVCKLVDRIFTNHFFDDPDGRLHEVVTFYANYCASMDKDTFNEVTDFITWKLVNEPRFRYKGRTVTSMVKLSNEWHLVMQKAKLGSHIEWSPLHIPYWEHAYKDELWTIEEIVTNKELANEGRKQKHCVYGYVSRCVDGRSHIFSMRVYEKRITGKTEYYEPIYDKSLETRRVTFETTDHTIVQIKGALNCPPTPEEKDFIKLWAGKNGLTFGRSW